LGGLFARHLVAGHGIRNLLLASRAGERAPGATQLAQELIEMGANVRIASCDVSDRTQLERLIASIAEEHPLRAVVHAAGALEDGVIATLTPERLQTVLAPKAAAAWYLHELTAGLALEAFVMFSSLTATLGNPGQGNYAAANAFLDALAAHRRAQGLPAISMAWGPWDQQVGMTGRLEDAAVTRLARVGMLPLPPEQGLALFDAAWAAEEALVVLAKIDAAAVRARARAGDQLSVLDGLVPRSVRGGGGRTDAGALLQQLTGLLPAERTGAILEFLRIHTAEVLGYLSADLVDTSRTFKDLGFDSLGAVELRNRIAAGTGLRLPTTLLFDYPTPPVLAAYILSEMAGGELEGAHTVALELDRLQPALAAMSIEEADRAGIAVRLRRILSEWEAPLNGDVPSTADDQIQSISDEQMLELIDREFGVS
jgi:acyl carrier protein